MITPGPIKLPDIDNYLEDLPAIAETAIMAWHLRARARKAVSGGAQAAAYAQLAQERMPLARKYQAGDAGEADFSFPPQHLP